MDQKNPTIAKILILDTRKFEQWQFRIQQYLQHEHYALWEVIEFGYSYEVRASVATTETASDGTGKKSRRTVALTAEDMQKRKNDELKTLKKEKERVNGKLARFLTASKDLDNLIESQRLDKNKDGLGYNDVPPPPAQIYSSVKKDLSWTGLLEFADDTNNIDDKGYWDNGCSRHMTGNISYLSDYEPFDGGYVSFGQGGCKITGKGTIKTGKLEFENVYFMKDLKYNLFSVSQICDNKNSVLFTDSECIVLGRDFKLLDDANILLRTPRQHNMYSIDLNNIVPHKDLTCLVAKASAEECMLWHRRLGHLNFKITNKLVRHNLVRGLPTKCFENDHTCTACLKGKQHKASLTDDFYRFTRTFFLRTKDETSGILKKFITKIENLKDLKVKIIRCDNGVEFRNKEMNDFCSQKRIKREFSNARTPQQNGVAERRNRTLIEAARKILADAKLPVTFWAEAVNTTCYVQNRVFVNKSHNKTPYELFNGRSPAIRFLKPFGCYVMILNTLDNLGKYIALPNWAHDALLESSSSKPQDNCSTEVPESSGNTNPTASTSNHPANQMETLTVESPIPTFEDILGVTTNSDESNRVEADVSNMEITITASPTPTLRVHKDHHKSQIIGPVDTPIQTRNKSKAMGEQSFIAKIHQKTDPALLQFCLFSCFLSQVEPKNISDALQDPSWNKKDERGIVIRNKARLVAQGHSQEEGIDYDEVFAPVARIEAIRLFLAYASFMGFIVYQIDVKSVFFMKKSEPNSQNMDFISLAKHIRGNEDVNTASVSTASTNVPTASANIGVVSISQDTACAYIASQSSGSQIKFKDINQIDKDDMEEMDIKWNMALLSMRADKFWKKTWKKISI
nr:hypothetical protein [Tanacetum cinerariifolium]